VATGSSPAIRESGARSFLHSISGSQHRVAIDFNV
jgi:hypothetical protein